MVGVPQDRWKGSNPGPSITEIIEALEAIVDLTGRQWLDRQRRKLEGSKREGYESFSFLASEGEHPLFFAFRKTEEALEKAEQTRFVEPNQEVVMTLQLARNLEAVKGRPLVGLDGAIMEKATHRQVSPRLRDPLSFEKTAYELEVAAAYLRAGMDAFFIEEGTEKTPDLLVRSDPSDVFIECTKKDVRPEKLTKLTNARNAVCHRVLNRMLELKRNLGILMSYPDLDFSQRTGEELFEEISERMTKGRVGTFHALDGDCPATVEELAPWDKEIQTSGFQVQTKAGIGFIVMGGMVQITGGGRILWKNPKFVAFESVAEEVELARKSFVRGVVSSLNQKYKQIPPRGPGLIYVDVVPHESFREEDYQLLEEEIRGRLNVIGRVNAVIISAPLIEKRADGIAYRKVTHTTKNRSPDSPLPKAFRLLGEPPEEGAN